MKQLYKVLIVIDAKSGELVYNYTEEPFKEFKIASTDDLSRVLVKYFGKDKTPIFDKIIVDKKQYWIVRKSSNQSIYYYIQECKYWNGILEEADKRSTIDGLTNIYNKKEIESQINRYLNSYLRYKKSSFSMMMFDIDLFKRVNDSYGHVAGDFVLRALSTLTKEVIRHVDVFGRFGGEEFIIILPETKIAGAIKLASRLRMACEKNIFKTNVKNLKITISIGVTSVSITDSLESLIERCDTALYDAKHKGRNRVEYR